MTLRIFIVRHAQPANQEEGYRGGPNYPLGVNGRIQADCVAQQFQEWGVGLDGLYSSAFARAIGTAEPLYKALRAPWHVWPALGETGRNEWPMMRELESSGRYEAHRERQQFGEGSIGQHEDFMPLSLIKDRYPDVILDQPAPYPDRWFPELVAETREQADARAEASIAAWKERYRGKDARIAVVCHGAFGSVLIGRLLGSPASDHNRYHQAHAAISRLDLYDDGTISSRYLNFVGHLPPDRVTEGVSL